MRVMPVLNDGLEVLSRMAQAKRLGGEDRERFVNEVVRIANLAQGYQDKNTFKVSFNDYEANLETRMNLEGVLFWTGGREPFRNEAKLRQAINNYLDGFDLPNYRNINAYKLRITSATAGTRGPEGPKGDRGGGR